jgi:hypothetical protein
VDVGVLVSSNRVYLLLMAIVRLRVERRTESLQEVPDVMFYSR